MAKRRMIARSVLYGDTAYSLTPEQLKLYIYMILEADDDGFVSNMSQILLVSGATRADLNTLIKCGMVIEFRSKICVIVHWLIHNETNRPGYKKTEHLIERTLVDIDEFNHYIEK